MKIDPKTYTDELDIVCEMIKDIKHGYKDFRLGNQKKIDAIN